MKQRTLINAVSGARPSTILEGIKQSLSALISSKDHWDSGNSARPQSRRNEYLEVRYLLDRCAAFAMLAGLAPLLATLYLAVKWTSKGDPIYRQTRLGRYGKRFSIYKFRSMRLDAEADGKPVWSKKGDPRVTPIGRFLRWSHLDELPQLWNIAKGEMALIGPRPERPEIVEPLCYEVDDYLQRHNVLPGVTGLSQVSLPPDTDLCSVRRKTILDLNYVRDVSFKLDAHILFCTCMLFFGLKRAVDQDTWMRFSRCTNESVFDREDRRDNSPSSPEAKPRRALHEHVTVAG